MKISKYQSDDWIFFFFSKYTYEKKFTFNSMPCTVNMSVENGIIKEIRFSGHLKNPGLDRLSEALTYKKHNHHVIAKILSTFGDTYSSLLVQLF